MHPQWSEAKKILEKIRKGNMGEETKKGEGEDEGTPGSETSEYHDK